MIPRRVFAVLTTILVVLTVACAVLTMFQWLLVSVGDQAAAKFLLRIGRACLVLLAIDLLLLVGALGIRAMQSTDNRSEGS